MKNQKLKLQIIVQKVLKVGLSSTTYTYYCMSAKKKLCSSTMFCKLHSPTRKSNTGFTLVELIVSLGLFIVVITISTGALLSLSDTSRKVQSTRIAIDNLNLALESMSKEIRMGTRYHCDFTELPIDIPRNCSSGESSIVFLSQDGNTIVYRLSGSGTVIERSLDAGLTFSDITAPEINIDYLSFYVFGTEATGPFQPRVIITLGGTAGVKAVSEFKIQTSVTRRAPNI